MQHIPALRSERRRIGIHSCPPHPITTLPPLNLAAKSQQSGISGRMLAISYLIAIVLGIVNGIWGSSATQSLQTSSPRCLSGFFKFVAIPIIAVSIISTLSSISKSRSSGRIFRHTIFYTLFTTIWRQRSPLCSTKSFSPEKRLRIDFRCCRSTAFERC